MKRKTKNKPQKMRAAFSKSIGSGADLSVDSSLGALSSNFDLKLKQDKPLSARESVQHYEDLLLSQPQFDIPVSHFFGDGVYVRKITLPKGVCATGRIHKYDHISIVVSGDMTVWSEDSGVRRIKGHSVVEVKAGMKRAGIAHEDTVWLTAHKMDRLNPLEIIDFLTVASYEEYDEYCRTMSAERLAS